MRECHLCSPGNRQQEARAIWLCQYGRSSACSSCKWYHSRYSPTYAKMCLVAWTSGRGCLLWFIHLRQNSTGKVRGKPDPWNAVHIWIWMELQHASSMPTYLFSMHPKYVGRLFWRVHHTSQVDYWVLVHEHIFASKDFCEGICKANH